MLRLAVGNRLRAMSRCVLELWTLQTGEATLEAAKVA